MGGKTATISNSEQRIFSLQIQQSTQGLTLPVVYGRARVAGNLIWYGDFTTYEHRTEQRTGKGGRGGVKQVNTSYTYEAALMIALCEGAVRGVVSTWRGKEKFSGLGDLRFSFFSGARGQGAWPHLQQPKHQAQAIGYSDTAYVASPNYQLTSNAQIYNHNFEIDGKFGYSDNIPDANPRDILTDLLTNSNYGCGFPVASLGDTDVYSTYCRASGIFLSPVYGDQNAAHRNISDLLKMTNSAAVFSQGRLKIVPYGDAPLSANGAVYAPNLTPLYDLTDDDFIADGEDPVSVERKTNADAYNKVTVEYLDRANDYNIAVAEASDQASIEKHGLRTADAVKMHAICDRAVAQQVAQLQLQRALYVRNEYEFKLSWKYCLLEPMDLVTLTDSALGLDKTPVRITEVVEDSDGLLTVRAEDFPFGIATATRYPTAQSSGGYTVNYNVRPENSHTPVIFEAPMQLTGGRPEIWLATSGGENWGGCEVWVSENGDSYKLAGRINAKSRYGSLTAPLAVGAQFDSANVMAVQVSSGQVYSGTRSEAEALQTACFVGGEYISYETAQLTGEGRYNLRGLVRGAFGSSITDHKAGEPFVRLDDSLFKYPFGQNQIGKTVWVKLVSFNVFGANLQEFSEVPAYSYKITGRPAGEVSNLRAVSRWGYGDAAVITWDDLPSASSYDVEVVNATTLQVLRQVVGITANEYTYSISDMVQDSGGTAYDLIFKVRARSAHGVAGKWVSLTAISPEVAAVSGLRVEAGIGETKFVNDLPVKWDVPEYAVSFDVEVYQQDGKTLLRRANGLVYPNYTYFLHYMQADGGLKRRYVVKVRGRSRVGKAGAWEQFTAENPQVAPLSGITIDSGLKQAFFNCQAPTESDYAGIVIWVSENASVPTTDANKVYDGQGTFTTITKCGGKALEGGKTYYLRAAAYDRLGKDGMQVGNSISFTVYEMGEIARELSESSLNQALREKINAVPDVSNIVAAEMAKEVVARTKAVSDAAKKAESDLLEKAGELGAKITAVEQVNATQTQQIQSVTAAQGATAAGLEAEKKARADGDRAEAEARNTLAARVATAEGAITRETQARIAADNAQTAEYNSLKSRVGNSESAIAAANNTIASNHSSMSQQVGEIAAKISTRPNLCPDVDTWTGDDFSVDRSDWGITLRSTSTKTVASLSPRIAVRSGGEYVLSYDSLLVNGEQVYCDLQGYDAKGVYVWDSEQSIRFDAHDFATDDANRRKNTIKLTIPNNVTSVNVRVFGKAHDGGIFGVRRVKLEYGGLPATAYSSEADIDVFKRAFADEKSAQAEEVRRLDAAINGQSAKIEDAARVTATLDGKVKAIRTLKVDANGHIAGLGLQSDIEAGKPVSRAIFNADQFGVGGVGNNVTMPFVVDTAKNRVGINGSLIVDGTITGDKILANSVLQSPVIKGGTLEVNSIVGGNIYDFANIVPTGRTKFTVRIKPSIARRFVKVAWDAATVSYTNKSSSVSSRDWVVTIDTTHGQDFNYRAGLFTQIIPANTQVDVIFTVASNNIVNSLTVETYVLSAGGFIEVF